MPIALKSASALLNKIALEHMINAPNVKEITALDHFAFSQKSNKHG
jgi:hypothetical protein